MEAILENYGIKLVRLTADKIDMVRNWRNDPKISQYMEYQEIITPEMQEKWFNSINNDNNLYYIVEYKSEEIGLINIKDIDYINKTGEGGVFIYNDRYLNTDISYKSHICLFDYYFFILNLDEIRSHVRGFNQRARRLTLYLGFKEVNETDFILKKEDYLNNRNRIRLVNKYKKLNQL